MSSSWQSNTTRPTVDATVEVVNIYEEWITERCQKIDRLCLLERTGIFSKPRNEAILAINTLWSIIIPYQSVIKNAERDLSSRVTRTMWDMNTSAEREAFIVKLRNVRKIEKTIAKKVEGVRTKAERTFEIELKLDV